MRIVRTLWPKLDAPLIVQPGSRLPVDQPVLHWRLLLGRPRVREGNSHHTMTHRPLRDASLQNLDIVDPGHPFRHLLEVAECSPHYLHWGPDRYRC